MRFSIRDLLWLTVVIGLATTLWLERRAAPPVRFTGQPLDIAIAGEGFFLLTDPQTSHIRFTRFGSLSIDSQSRLILESNGVEYIIDPAMCMPSEATGISISPTGRVAVQVKNKAELVAIGQIQLAKFDKPNKLQQIAPAIYIDTTESGPACQCNPGEQDVGTIIQGALTKHN